MALPRWNEGERFERDVLDCRFHREEQARRATRGLSYVQEVIDIRVDCGVHVTGPLLVGVAGTPDDRVTTDDCHNLDCFVGDALTR